MIVPLSEAEQEIGWLGLSGFNGNTLKCRQFDIGQGADQGTGAEYIGFDYLVADHVETDKEHTVRNESRGLNCWAQAIISAVTSAESLLRKAFAHKLRQIAPPKIDVLPDIKTPPRPRKSKSANGADKALHNRCPKGTVYCPGPDIVFGIEGRLQRRRLEPRASVIVGMEFKNNEPSSFVDCE